MPEQLNLMDSASTGFSRTAETWDFDYRLPASPVQLRPTARRVTRRIKVVFPYIAQPHQIYHSFPIAAEMAQRHPDFDVHVAYDTDAQEAVVYQLAKLYPDAPLSFQRLHVPRLVGLPTALGIGSVPLKVAVLHSNRDYLSQFDAIVVPERTSLYIKSGLKLPKVKLIWTRHGAGDRKIGYADDVSRFDFVLMAGRKSEERLLASGAIRPGDYFVGSYAKFDVVQRIAQQAPKLFDNERKTVLYNPHFSSSLSSWHKVGRDVLDFFAASDQYNLIFAPHVRLFDPATRKALRSFEKYADLPHMHIDLGSERSIDMSYTLAADLYLGDVSSQVAEFLLRPRPCIFLNSRRSEWQNSPDFLFWHCGTVLDDIDGLEQSLDNAIAEHPHKLPAQENYFRETFSLPEGQASAVHAAAAVAEYMRR